MPKKMKNCHKFTNRMAVIWFGRQAKGATIKSQFTNCLWFHMCWIKLFSFWLSFLLFFILPSSRFELWVPGILMVPHNSMPNNSNDRKKKRKMSTMKERVCERQHKKKCTEETSHIFPLHKMWYFAMYFVALLLVFVIVPRWSETGMSTRYKMAQITGSLIQDLYIFGWW